MRHIHALSRPATVVAALAVIGVLPPLAIPAAAAHVAHIAAQGTCAVPGTYQVGPRILPMTGARPPRPGARPSPPVHSGSSSTAIAWPAWALRGTLDIRAYSGCGNGAATTGSFSVRSVAIGPPILRPNKGAPAMPCYQYQSCWWPALGVVSATGTFAQDPLHAADPTYVVVSATITTTRPGPQMGRPCSVETGCPPPVVMTSTVSFSGVTGYLQVGAPQSPSATLSFLPPPAANTVAAPTALVLEGWRGSYKPLPTQVPPPSQ